ncbi:hypothetical protein, partial [Bacillus altitudinis]|uniref:hypothetical protein n=1 Tax=Bacillus altitudinis TaxID=293387 RepID=UPI0037C766E7
SHVQRKIHKVFIKNVKTPLLLEVKVGFVYGLNPCLARVFCFFLLVGGELGTNFIHQIVSQYF